MDHVLADSRGMDTKQPSCGGVDRLDVELAVDDHDAHREVQHQLLDAPGRPRGAAWPSPRWRQLALSAGHACATERRSSLARPWFAQRSRRNQDALTVATEDLQTLLDKRELLG